jgi:hypothetical protein
MLNDDQLEESIKDLIMDICEVMYRRGYDKVPVGAMMRLVGVSDDRAQLHDQQHLALDQEFRIMLEARKDPQAQSTPQGVTLH